MAIQSNYDSETNLFNVELEKNFTFEETTDLIKLYENLPDGVSVCALDFSKVEYMDSAALGALLLIKTRLEENGISDIRLINCQPEILKLLEVCQYEIMFAINP